MTICKFYQQGYCRYGNNCRFEHLTGGGGSNYQNRGNSQSAYFNSPRGGHFGRVENDSFEKDQFYRSKLDRRTASGHQSPVDVATPTFQEFLGMVKHEVEASFFGKQWPFSCYAPIKDGDNLPGFVDVSPEELRFAAYQQRESMSNYIKQAHELQNQFHQLRNQLLQPNSQTLEILETFFKKKNNEFDKPLHQPNSTVLSPLGHGIPQSTTSSNFRFSLSHLDKQPNPSSVFGSSVVMSPNTFGFGSIHGPTNTSSFSQGNTSTAASSPWPSNSFTAFQSPVSIGLTESPLPFGSSVANNASQSFGGNNSAFNSPNVGGSFVGNTNEPWGQASFLQNRMTIPAMRDKAGTLYSNIDDLTEEERSQFAAQSFTLGKLPTRPPPLEFCN